MYIGIHVQYPLFLPDSDCNFHFLYRMLKNVHVSNLIKIIVVGSELFQADGRTDMTELIVSFRNFTKASKNKNSRLHH